MNLINELKTKSENAENTKQEIINEIKKYFDEYLDGDKLENYLKQIIGESEINKRQVFMKVEFWGYHDGCSDTHFYCGGKMWYNPENKSGWKSRSYRGVELRTIDEEIGEYLSAKLMDKMEQLGFNVLSSEKQNGRLGYYNKHFYFGW
jgi:hypothetical protein